MKSNSKRKNVDNETIGKLSEYGVLGYVWVLFISIWGGTAHYLSRKNKKLTVMGWLSEITIAGFAGIMTALICQHYHLEFLLSSAIIGVASHGGVRTLKVINSLIMKQVNFRAEPQVEEMPDKTVLCSRRIDEKEN